MDFSAYKKNIMPNVAESYSEIVRFGYCLFEEPSFRNVVLNRLHGNLFLYVLFRMFFKPVESLYINMKKSGEGYSSNMGFLQSF